MFIMESNKSQNDSKNFDPHPITSLTKKRNRNHYTISLHGNEENDLISSQK